MTNPVQQSQRVTKHRPCEVCGGHPELKTKQGIRCTGYVMDDQRAICCTNSAYDHGKCKPIDGPELGYRHWRYGPCDCGTTHNPAEADPEAQNRPRRAATGPKASGIPKEIKNASKGQETPQAEPQGLQLFETYVYQLADRSTAQEILRYHPKTFRVRSPAPNGNGWVWQRGPHNPLYKLPEILESPDDETVYVVEGEKDANLLTSWGYTATTNAGGAGKFTPEHAQTLAGRKICIIPDNDQPGFKHANQIAQLCQNQNTTIHYLEIPNGKDLSEWANLTPNAQDAFDHLKPKTWPGPLKPRQKIWTLHDQAEIIADTTWIHPGWIPNGYVSMLVGRSGLGKSLYALQGIVAPILHPDRFTFTDGTRCTDDLLPPNTQRKVLWLDSEGGIGLNKSRCQRLGIDMRGLIHPAQPGSELDPLASAGMQLDDPECWQAFEATLDDHRPALAVIDSLSASNNLKENDAKEMKRLLQKLSILSQRTGIGILVIHHPRKADVERKTPVLHIEDIRGSSAIIQFCRSIIAMDTPDEQDDAEIRVRIAKTNLGDLPNPIGCQIDERLLTIIPEAPEQPKERSARGEAMDFLKDFLRRGEQPADEIYKAGKLAGHSARTLRRAKTQLAVLSIQKRSGAHVGQWVWGLPAQNIDCDFSDQPLQPADYDH